MKLIVFDADGTLTRTASGKQFPETPSDKILQFNPKNLYHPNVYLAVASNQKGVSLGFKTSEFLEEEFAYLDDLTEHIFNCFIICPDDGESVWIKREHEEQFIRLGNQRGYQKFSEFPYLSGCESLIGTFRKPEPGMLQLAEKIATWSPYGTREITDRIFIGDRESDQSAAQKAGFRFWYIDDFLQEINKATLLGVAVPEVLDGVSNEISL